MIKMTVKKDMRTTQFKVKTKDAVHSTISEHLKFVVRDAKAGAPRSKKHRVREGFEKPMYRTIQRRARKSKRSGKVRGKVFGKAPTGWFHVETKNMPLIPFIPRAIEKNKKMIGSELKRQMKGKA